MWCCNLTIILQLTGFEVLADLQAPVSTLVWVSSWAVYGQNCKKNISRAHFPLDQPFILGPILYCADAKKLISLQTWATYWWDHHDASKQYSHTKRLTCHISEKKEIDNSIWTSMQMAARSFGLGTVRLWSCDHTKYDMFSHFTGSAWIVEKAVNWSVLKLFRLSTKLPSRWFHAQLSHIIVRFLCCLPSLPGMF